MSGKTLTIDGGQAKEEDVGTYTAIREAEPEFRSSKSSLAKSKEKLSADGAEEKLLQKEDEAKITTRVTMADAKYVVDDHRNGDAKIELDANKRQFSGLTREELLKYADDPFWVRLRWVMFVLFWALWLCMLAGAIAIIVSAPRCPPRVPRPWYEQSPSVEWDGEVADYEGLKGELETLKKAAVQAVMFQPCQETYEVLDSTTCLDQFKNLVASTKDSGIKFIVDLTANFVPVTHAWFVASANRSSEFSNYFTWAVGRDFDDTQNRPKPPNEWVSVLDEPMWSWSEQRQQYYLHHFSSQQPDLNFREPAVAERFDQVISKWMEAGAAGVRLLKARHLFVSEDLALNEKMASGSQLEGDHKSYSFYSHALTADQPALAPLLQRWASLVAQAGADKVFTIAEDDASSPFLKTEWYLLQSQNDSSALRPPQARPRALANVTALADDLKKTLNGSWPALKLTTADAESQLELSKLALLLPAAPLLPRSLALAEDNSTAASERFKSVAELRGFPALQHGAADIAAAPAGAGQVLVVARWKEGGAGYVGVFNPAAEEARANLTGVASLPAALAPHYLTERVRLATNYTTTAEVDAGEVLVPARSTVIFSYKPKTVAEK